jgi:hypothetical protein
MSREKTFDLRAFPALKHVELRHKSKRAGIVFGASDKPDSIVKSDWDETIEMVQTLSGVWGLLMEDLGSPTFHRRRCIDEQDTRRLGAVASD